jgi:hypothetical protein
MKQILLACFLCVSGAAFAQTPSVPKNLPLPSKGGNLPTPKKIITPMPDLVFVSVNVIGVDEVTEQHMFRIKLSITYKNNGNADVDKNFWLDLLGTFEDRGGTNSYIIGSPCNLHPLAAGQSRTEEWWFYKDITQLGRGHHSCMVRIDSNDRIKESDERNNTSPLFDINIL